MCIIYLIELKAVVCALLSDGIRDRSSYGAYYIEERSSLILLESKYFNGIIILLVNFS